MLEDRIYRSLGVLQNARILGSDEFMGCLSDVRLGISMGLIQGLGYEAVNSLLCDMQPANLIEADPAAQDPAVRDRERADRVREAMQGVHA